MDIRQSAVDRTKRFESFVAHFYLDTKDKVTVGYGQMLPTAASADAILMKDGAAVATNPVKRAAWTAVNAAEGGHAANWYANLTTIRHPKADAETNLKANLRRAGDDLLVRFPALDSYPEDAQDALLDLMFNIGLTKFTQAKWPNLFAAVLARKWDKAADESRRDDVPAARNDEIAALFRGAAVAFVGATDPAVMLPMLDEFTERRLASVMDFSRGAAESSKLFPHGITKIRLAAKVGGVEVEIELEGPSAAT